MADDDDTGGKKGKKGKKDGEKSDCTKKKLFIYFAICLFFLFIGGVFELILGIYHEHRLIGISNFCDGKYHICPLIVVGCGFVVIIASFIGLFGITRDNFMLLVAFFRTVLCTGLIEFVCLLLGVGFMFDKSGIYKEKLAYYIKLYTKFYEAVDLVQSTLKCCGYENISDYEQGYPSSCCKADTKIFCSELYEDACKKKLDGYLGQVGLTMALLCFLLLCIKACSCAVCWFFARKVRDGVQYGDDEDPAKLKAKEEKKQEKKERRKKKRKEKRAKKKKKAEAFQKKEEEKERKKNKNKKKKSPVATVDTTKDKKEKKPKKEKEEKPKKEKKEKPKKEKKGK